MTITGSDPWKGRAGHLIKDETDHLVAIYSFMIAGLHSEQLLPDSQ
jgi:hypothetical protein